MTLELIVPDWPAPPKIRALVTTRNGGVSSGPYASLNLATHVGDDPAAVTRNRALLRAHLPAEPVWLEQVHGTDVQNAALGNARADASYARQSEIVCAVMTADCLPVLFCDRHATVVAAAHAGWRGLVAGVLESTISAMAAHPEDILAWLGPAIGPLSFEVGDEVRAKFVDAHSASAAAFMRQGDRWLADLYALARLRLHAAGIARIYGGGECTFRDRERFFSFRRDGETGRMASLIWLA